MFEECRFEGRVKRIVVSRIADDWYASISIEVDTDTMDNTLDARGKNHANARRPVGVDVGIKTLAYCSDGAFYENPKPLEKALRKLRKADKAVSRRKIGSRGQKKAGRRKAKIHVRVGNIRHHNQHVATTDIVRRAIGDWHRRTYM